MIVILYVMVLTDSAFEDEIIIIKTLLYEYISHFLCFRVIGCSISI